MSYTYTIINTKTKVSQEVEGYNLWNALSKIGMIISRVDELPRHYLQKTPFDKRERYVWGGDYGNELFLVKQRKH